MWLAFLANYALTFAVLLALWLLLWGLLPFGFDLPEENPLWLRWLVQGLVWLGTALFVAGSGVLSLLISLALMGFWFETLAGRVVAHHRPAVPAPPWRVGAALRAAWQGLKDSAALLALSVLALFLGFIPVIGWGAVIGMQSYLLGREIGDPYLNVCRELCPGLRLNSAGWASWASWARRFWTVRIGLAPFLLALVPLLGWMLMPVVIVHFVLGVAWQGESERQRRLAVA